MIPKKIHYCWFGGNPLPEDAVRCIESWKKFLPDYEICRWDESNYDISKIAYTREAYEAKKYAFVSDYARFDILFHEGGLYFDTDVEVIGNIDDIISAGPFMGCENEATPNAPSGALGVAPGLGLGVNPGLGLYSEILAYYKDLHFINPDGSFNEMTIVKHTTNILVSKGLINTPEIQKVAGVTIYPKEYFCPLDYSTGVLKLTSNSRTIHHYTASWMDDCGKLTTKLTQKLSFLPIPVAGRIALFVATLRTKGISAAFGRFKDWVRKR